MAMDRLFVSAAHKSSGKTTVTLGLAAALAAQGTRVQPFKKGPDYIDPMWLAAAAGRYCFNLDLHLQDPAALAGTLALALPGAQLALIEGNKGLHDGLRLDGRDSNAELAKALAAPVLLVLDTRGMTRGIAPLVLGLQMFDRGVRIGGLVLNRVKGSRHEGKLRAVLEHYTGVPVLGAVADDPRLAMTERHLGLMPCAEVDDAATRVAAIGRIVAAQVDLDAVRRLAASAGPWPAGIDVAAAATPPARRRPELRIGIARGRACGFYYPDDLAALEACGAELVPVDLLHDQRLPPLDGLFIGGGFPEACLDELQANAAMRSALRQAIGAGLPTYAECGGLMILSRSIEWKGRRAPMVGVIPGDAVMHDRPVGRGYVELQETAAMPWPAVAGPDAAALVRGHEFHHSTLVDLDPGLDFAYRVRRGHGVDGTRDGVLVHNLLASYTHLRTSAGGHWAPRFVEFVRRERMRAGEPQAAQAACWNPR